MSRQKRWLFNFVAVVAVLAAGIAGWNCLRPGPGVAPRPQTSAPDTAPAGDAGQTISFVILPPDGGPFHEGHAEAVALFCDLLAERLSKAPGIAVVDRSRLDRILAEKAIGGREQPPVVSYDAMVRVRPAGSADNPTIVVEVVDLSLGNLAASGQWPWQPESDEAVSKATDLCVSARRALASRSDSRLKVRVLHVPQPLRTARVESFGESLCQALTRRLEDSPGVRVVHHLEAMSAKEESLLLLLGLSRLAEGRLFVPQADLSVELRLVEREAVGRSFDDTPIDVTASVNWAGKGSDTVSVSGTPGERQSLLERLEAALVKRMAKLETAPGQPDDMALRRRQALLELQRTDQWDIVAYKARELPVDASALNPQHQSYLQRINELADIAATAAKLDPRFEEAAYQAAKFGFVARLAESDLADGSPALREALVYIRRFREVPDHLADIVELVQRGLARHGMVPFAGFPAGWQMDWFDYKCGYWKPGKGARREPVELLREIIDLTLAQEAVACPHFYYGDMIWAAYLGMIDAGVDPAQARRWRDAANARAIVRLRQAVAGPKPGRISEREGCDAHCAYVFCCNHLSLAMTWAEKEEGIKSARALLEGFIAAGPSPDVGSGADSNLYSWLGNLRDAELEKRFRTWAKREITYSKTAPKIRLKWPGLRQTGEEEPKAAVTDSSRYLLAGRDGQEVVWEPLGWLDGRLYVLYWLTSDENIHQWHRGMGWIELPMASSTAPALRGEQGVVVHTAPPFPGGPEKPLVSCWALTGGKVALGTVGRGILVFDAKTRTWRQHGPAEGLPLASVMSVTAVREDLVLACGAAATVRHYDARDAREEDLYTVNLSSGKVTLVRRHIISGSGRQRLKAYREETQGICMVWKAGDELVALGKQNMVRNLLGSAPRIEPWRVFKPLPWPRRPPTVPARQDVTIASAATANGHVFVQASEGLMELDELLAPVEQWRTPTHIAMDFAVQPLEDEDGGNYDLWIPGEIPRIRLLGGSGQWLVMRSGRNLLLLNAASRQWYGPVGDGAAARAELAGPEQCVVEGDVLALGGGIFSISQIVAAAKAAGLAYSDEQFRELHWKSILNQPPRDAMKQALLSGRFDQTRRMLDAELQSAPDDPELLLLAGWLHDTHALNKPAKTVEYYQRLADMNDNPPARLTGLLALCFHYWRHGRIPEAANLVATIEQEFPNVSAYARPDEVGFGRLAVRVKQAMAKGDAARGKQPASAASNR